MRVTIGLKKEEKKKEVSMSWITDRVRFCLQIRSLDLHPPSFIEAFLGLSGEGAHTQHAIVFIDL